MKPLSYTKLCLGNVESFLFCIIYMDAYSNTSSFGNSNWNYIKYIHLYLWHQSNTIFSFRNIEPLLSHVSFNITFVKSNSFIHKGP